MKIVKILLKMLADTKGARDANAATTGHGRAVSALAATYRGLKSAASSALSGIASGLRGLRNGALAAGAGMAVAVRDAVNFNVSLSRAVNMFGGNKMSNFVAFRKEILDMSADLGVAKEQLSEALYTAGSAQFSPEDSFKAIRIAAQGAIADGAEVNDVLAGIVAAYKTYGGDVGQVAEKLYRVVQLGQTTFGEVGQFLNSVTATAGANKVSLEEVGGALAQTTSKTIKTSTALVSLSIIMSKLNKELGDNWRDKFTFQDALEEVSKRTGRSQTALAKIFGDEPLRVVNTMINENFAAAKQQVAEFQGRLNGLKDAFDFAQTFRGFHRFWTSVKAAFTDIGIGIEGTLRPTIDGIVAKVQSLRDSGGFKSLVESVSKSVGGAAEKLVAGVQTAVDLLGKSVSLGGLLSGAVNGLIDLAIALLAEGLRSLGTVMVALAKVFSSALAADFMKMDLPFRDEMQNAIDAAREKLQSGSMAKEQMDAFDVPAEFRKGGFKPENIFDFKAWKKRFGEWGKGQGLDRMADIATSSRDANIEAAITDALKRFAASSARLESAGDRIIGNLGKRTGVDIKAVYAGNLSQTREAFAPPPPFVGPPRPPDDQPFVGPPERPASTATATSSARAPLTAKQLAARSALNDDVLGAERDLRSARNSGEGAAEIAKLKAELAAARKARTEAIKSGFKEVSDEAAKTNEALKQGFDAMLSEMRKLSQTAKDAASRAKQPGG